MTGYQAGIQKFTDTETEVFGVSTDNTPSQKAFAEQLKLSFPILSDFVNRKVSTDYGVLVAERGFSSRTTFVIDKEGKITFLEEGNSAVDITGAATACSRLKH
ncbi:MAG: redoxin domain-containing protein [Bryobacterales bacterium]|nr:redoxin domain-containing protein [Bryobacterales bacterium]